MAGRPRLAALGVAAVLLVLVDVTIAHVDVFRPLIPETRPTTLFAAMNLQVTEVVAALRYPLPGLPRIVFVGNSQLEAAIGPLQELDRSLVDAGAPPGTQTVSLCVFGTAATDAEVIARDLGRARPRAVILGLAAPDLGTTLDRARGMPVTHMLDTGFRDGLVPPADWESRLDRWARTVWRLYRYRVLLHDLLVPSGAPRKPPLPPRLMTPAMALELEVGPDRARELLAMRATYERTQDPADFIQYVQALRGRDYLDGIRDRWRGLELQPLQLEAVRRFTAHVLASGARPAWLLLPENPLLERDPEVGSDVARVSNEVATRLAAESSALGVPLLDLRHALPPSAFVDLNHLFFSNGAFFPALTEALRTHGFLDAGGRV